MIDRTRLTEDLQALVKRLEDDLRERAGGAADLRAHLDAEWRKGKEARRTSESFEEWVESAYTQSAVAWVLACVFVRYLEDNGYLERPYLSGPGPRAEVARDHRMEAIRRSPRSNERDYAFRFGRREAAEALRQRGGPDVASGSGVQALRIPFLASTDDLPASEAEAVRRLLDDECFPTVIRLPLRSQDLLPAVAARLRAIDARTLLFLDHLSCIRVTDGTGRREWSRDRGAGWEELRVDGVTVSRWIVRSHVVDPPLFLPIRIADVELGGPEDDVRALLAALRVREFSYREILLKVVLPAASDDVDPLPEDRLFEVYRYLRSYRSVARSGDKDVDAHARSVHVFCQAADGGPRERRPAGAVYFGRAWTGDADIETAMGGPGEARFLAPVPEFLGEDADGWREFFTWLGVARAPRVVAGSRVSLSLAHQRPDAALFGAWGYEEWLESLGSQRSCSMQHEEDTFVSARLDGLGELILAQDPARSLAYFRLLATHWASYAAALVCEVRCNHGWHRGGSETRRVESYLSWVLRHAPWLPTRWNGRVGPVSPARAIWSIRDPFVGQRVRAFLLALPPEAEGELCEALRAYLRLADPSSATVQEWLDLMAEIPRRIPAEALSEPAVADQATSVFRWAAKHLDEALKRSSAGRPADLGGGIELPARTVEGVRYHSPSEVLFADDPDLQSRWRDACAFVEMDDDLALARSRLGIRAVSQAVTIEPAFEGASAAAAASEFALLSSVLPDFLALVATTRPSTIDRIVPRIRRLRLIVVQTIRLRQRLVGTDLEPRDELEHVHLTRETEVLLGAVEAVRGTLYVTEPPIASRDEYAEELARFVELPQMGDTLAILLSATPERRAHLLERRGVTPDLLEAMRRRLEQPEDAEDALLATLRARLQQEVRSSPPGPAGLGAPTPGASDQVHTSSLTAPPGMVAPGTPDGQEQVPPPAEPGLPALDLDQLTCTDYAPTGQVGAEDGGAHRSGGGGGPTFSLARQIGMDARKVRDGRRGEEAVLAMERLRLQRAGRPDLADAVVHRADKSAYADRDIESFEVDGTPILIEVKSTADDHMAACFISVAELRQARDLGDRYYLYRVWRVREALPAIDRIKNPVKLLLDGRIGIDFGDLVIRFPELESGE